MHFSLLQPSCTHTYTRAQGLSQPSNHPSPSSNLTATTSLHGHGASLNHSRPPIQPDPNSPSLFIRRNFASGLYRRVPVSLLARRPVFATSPGSPLNHEYSVCHGSARAQLVSINSNCVALNLTTPLGTGRTAARLGHVEGRHRRSSSETHCYLFYFYIYFPLIPNTAGNTLTDIAHSVHFNHGSRSTS